MILRLRVWMGSIRTGRKNCILTLFIQNPRLFFQFSLASNKLINDLIIWFLIFIHFSVILFCESVRKKENTLQNNLPV